MELITNDFLAEAKDIENSAIFLEDNGCEPKTEWIEEIDSRTNFPFYWNSNTKESVWDMPKEYNEYLLKYEMYLRDLIVKCDENKKNEMESENNKNINDIKGLIEYSDSEEESIINVDSSENLNKLEEISQIESSPKEQETEDLLMKKENWMNGQAEEAEKYLKSIIVQLSENVKNKVDYLEHENYSIEHLKQMSIQIMTRLEDWSEGHLTTERKVEKLRSALIETSCFEASLETDKWKLNWNSERNQYFCINPESGTIISELSATKNCCEDGEIVEDEDDLAFDLEEYVSTTLHRSFLDDDPSSNSNEMNEKFQIDTPCAAIGEDECTLSDNQLIAKSSELQKHELILDFELVKPEVKYASYTNNDYN